MITNHAERPGYVWWISQGLDPGKGGCEKSQDYSTWPIGESESLDDISVFVNHSLVMQNINISSKVDEDTWNELKALAAETHQNLSGVLTAAIREQVSR